MRTSLYRHFDADGNLLYVGISLNHIARLAQHSKGSDWFASIARIEIEHHETRRLAERAEERAIADESPLHNKSDATRKLSSPVEMAADKIASILEGLEPGERPRLLKMVCDFMGVDDPTSHRSLEKWLNERQGKHDA